jgi:hypothetical protein
MPGLRCRRGRRRSRKSAVGRSITLALTHATGARYPVRPWQPATTSPSSWSSMTTCRRAA